MMEIRELEQKEIGEALKLTWNVFKKFEAPDYCRQGVDNFFNCLTDSVFIASLKFYGAFEGKKLVGTLATRSQGNHIALFFVDEKYHRKGIGRKLFERVCRDNLSGKMTVHSSPYATEVYHHLGFVDEDVEQSDGGIRYIPMSCDLKLRNKSC